AFIIIGKTNFAQISPKIKMISATLVWLNSNILTIKKKLAQASTRSTAIKTIDSNRKLSPFTPFETL
ncbi:hypothetical protein, partial [Helicobacter japonicus]|uniref:hypothetical protein n=1 Tax=Helicobacter japonicus TaxID=425400 RepID=UPI00259B18A9